MSDVWVLAWPVGCCTLCVLCSEQKPSGLPPTALGCGSPALGVGPWPPALCLPGPPGQTSGRGFFEAFTQLECEARDPGRRGASASGQEVVGHVCGAAGGARTLFGGPRAGWTLLLTRVAALLAGAQARQAPSAVGRGACRVPPAARRRVGEGCTAAWPWLPHTAAALGVHTGAQGAVERVREGRQVLQRAQHPVGGGRSGLRHVQGRDRGDGRGLALACTSGGCGRLF